MNKKIRDFWEQQGEIHQDFRIGSKRNGRTDYYCVSGGESKHIARYYNTRIGWKYSFDGQELSEKEAVRYLELKAFL